MFQLSLSDLCVVGGHFCLNLRRYLGVVLMSFGDNFTLAFIFSDGIDSMRFIACSIFAFALGAIAAQAAETAAPASADPVTPFDMRRVARKIEPELKGDPARLSQ